MERTKEQLSAINSRGKNVLVSASAGSGKTSVMIERIVNIILNKEAGIDEILATTFTKLAAEEMKQRLLKALKQSGSKDEFVLKSIRNLPYADISTIHSFCVNLIRKYFYLLDVGADFKIIEETDASQLKQEVIDFTFTNLYSSENPAFLRLAKKYTRYRQDTAFKNYVLSLYNYVESEKDRFGFLRKSLKYYCKQGSDELLQSFYEMKKGEINDLLPHLFALKDYKSEKWDKFSISVEQMINSCHEFSESLEKAKALSGIEFSLPRVLKLTEEEKDEKEYLKACKEKLESVFSSFKEFASCCENTEIIELAGKDYSDLADVVEIFSKEYSQIKRDKNVLDFADLEYYAIKLLSNEQTANEVKNKYKFILVDEYQDVNSAQEYIIDKISNNNLFLVGDVKQSIYGFRGCNSDIFLTTKARFLNGEGEYIELKENFRSAKNVINGVNNIFSKVMTEDLMGIDYKSSPMKYGGLYKNYDGETKLYFCEKDETDEENNLETYDLLQDAFSESNSSFKEGEQVLAIIKENVGKDYYDVKSGSLQKICFSDITILVRSMGNFTDKLIKYLLKSGIRVSCQNKNKEPDYPEINVLIGILKLLIRLSDVPLAIALKSEMGCLTEEELCKIRLNYPTGTFVEAVKNYDKNDELKDKINAFFIYYDNLRLKAEFENAGSILGRILSDTGMEVRFGSSAFGKAKLDRVYRFMNAVKEMSVESVINAMETGALKINFSSVSDDDSVKIMTMHASKGLEFPVVILANCSARFNKDDLKKDIVIDRDYGVAVKYFDEVNKRIYYKLPHMEFVKYCIDKIIKKEEARLFYVATTRAKYKLFIIGKKQKDKVVLEENKFLDFIKDGDVPQGEIVNLKEEIFDERKERTVFCNDYISDYVSEIKKNLQFKYDFENVPVKKSVSELSEFSFDDDRVYERLNLGSTSTEIGTAYHKFLQVWDFSSDFNELFSSLQENGFSQEEIALLDKEKLSDICSMPIFKELKKYKLYKEKNFIVSVPYNLISDSTSTKEVVVQGTIDLLCLDEKGNAIIVDYKFSSLKNDEDLIEKYQKQLFLYKYAVEKLLKVKAKRYIFNIYSCKIINLD